MTTTYAPPAPAWTAAAIGAAIGFLTIGMVAESAGGGSDDPVYIGAVAVAGVVLLGLMAVLGTATVRSQQRARGHLVTGSTEIVTGAVASTPLPGLVRRTGKVRLTPAFVAGTPGPVQDLLFPRLLSVTVLDHDGPREVGALAPGGMAPWAPGVPVVVQAHPWLHDVGVVDPRVSRAELDAVRADPRWPALAVPGGPGGPPPSGPVVLRLLLAAGGSTVGVVLGLVVTTVVGAW